MFSKLAAAFLTLALALSFSSCLQQGGSEDEPSNGTPTTPTGPTSSPTPTPTPTATPKPFAMIFASTTFPDPSAGIAAFDAACAADATAQGLTGTYKAMIAGLTLRHACTTANCEMGVEDGLDWVLRPHTQYRRIDQTTVIGTTNWQAIFDFPLTNAIDPNAFVWTGLRSDWTTYGAIGTGSCEDWSMGSGRTGATGNANTTTSDALQDTNYPTRSCAALYPAYCVEQVLAPTPPPTSFKKIFITTNSTSASTGNLSIDQLDVFDAFCASEATARSLSGTYKALVASKYNPGTSTTDRYACSSANCTTAGASENANWVLTPNTEYRRADGLTVIGTTTANAIFTFPLQNSFDASTNDFWSGIGQTWQKVTNCGDWQYRSSGASAYVGRPNFVTWKGFSHSTMFCSTSHRLACVEQ